jgi:tetratricopeptide (TPR) repeat protein
MQALIQAQDVQAGHLIHCAKSLLRQRDMTEAQRFTNKAEEVLRQRQQPLDPPDLVVLKAQLFEARDQGDKALDLLRDYVRRKDAKPEDLLLIVFSLSRQKRVSEALDVCEKAWQTCPVVIVSGASVALLREAQNATPATDAQCERVEEHVRAAIQSNPRVSILLVHLADLLDLRRRYQEAEKQYRLALELDKDNIVALNNLAWLLAQRSGKGDEALQWMNHALEIAGPRPELLDTRAIVYLTLKRSDLALADLERASSDTPTAMHYFHMARAQVLGENAQAAADALREAKKRGLKRKHLHPIEEVAAGKLFEELDTQ